MHFSLSTIIFLTRVIGIIYALKMETSDNNFSNNSTSRYDFMGREFPLAIVDAELQKSTDHEDRLPIITKNGQNTVQSLGDTMDYHMLAYVQDTLNFTAHIQKSHLWAYLNNNNEWEGMADLLLKNKIEYAADGAYMLSHRVKRFRFLAIGYKNKLSAYFQIPTKVGKGTGYGFYSDVVINAIGHLVIFLVLIVIFLVILVIFTYKIDISSAIILIIGNIASQGLSPKNLQPKQLDGYGYGSAEGQSQSYYGHWLLNTTSIKLFFFTISLCFYIWNVHVAASLISTFSTKVKTISNLQDLIDEGYSFGVLNDSYLIKTSTDDNVPKYLPLEYVMKNASLETLTSGIEKILVQPKFALLTEVIYFYDVFNQVTNNSGSDIKFCDYLREIKLSEEPIHIHGFVKQGSNISDPINYALAKMSATGIIKRHWLRKEQHYDDSTPSCRIVKDDTIHLYQVQSLFILFIGSTPLSIICCLLERLLYKLERIRGKGICYQTNNYNNNINNEEVGIVHVNTISMI